MEVRSKYESALILDKIEIIESSFRKKDGSLDDLELGVQVDHSLNKIGDDKFELILTTKVADQDEKVCVWVLWFIYRCSWRLCKKTNERMYRKRNYNGMALSSWCTRKIH